MKHHGRTLILGMSVLLIGALALVGYQAHALQRMAQLEPAVVATVDLLKVFEAIEERNAEAKEIDAQLEELVKEKGAKEAMLKKYEADLEDFQPGTPQYRQAEQTLIREALRFDGWTKFAGRKMDILNAEAVQRLYLSVKEAAGTMATENGYDLVLVDDELHDFIPGVEADIMRQISARRMLYSTQVIDITDALIERMNARSGGN